MGECQGGEAWFSETSLDERRLIPYHKAARRACLMARRNDGVCASNDTARYPINGQTEAIPWRKPNGNERGAWRCAAYCWR